MKKDAPKRHQQDKELYDAVSLDTISPATANRLYDRIAHASEMAAGWKAEARKADARIAELEANHAALCEAVLTLNALEVKVELLARQNQVPSVSLSKQLRDQWAEAVRLAKQGTAKGTNQ